MTRILIVEDNEMIRDLLQHRLQRRGYEVVSAGNGEAGMETAFAKTPDLILMDMNLPIIDGWEATRRLKADERTLSTPIIGVTAHAIAGDRERCLEAGCDDYIPKPVDFEALIQSINRLTQS